MKTIKLGIETASPNLAWKMFEIHIQERQGNLPWMNSDEMHLRTLGNMIAEFPLLGDIDSQSLVVSNLHLATGYHRLPWLPQHWQSK